MPSGPPALAPEIERFREEFERLSAEGDGLAGPLSDEQFFWRPSPEAWSVAHCLDHLNVVARLYLPRLDEAISDAIRRGIYGAGPYSYNWIGRFTVYMQEPPVRLRLQAPGSFVPQPGRPRAEIMAAYRAYQVQFIDRLRQANGLDLARAKVSSPVATWLRFSLGSGFELMAAHERRHLWQARNIVDSPDFPGNVATA